MKSYFLSYFNYNFSIILSLFTCELPEHLKIHTMAKLKVGVAYSLASIPENKQELKLQPNKLTTGF